MILFMSTKIVHFHIHSNLSWSTQAMILFVSTKIVNFYLLSNLSWSTQASVCVD